MRDRLRDTEERTNEILLTLIIPNLAEDVGYKVSVRLSIASIGTNPPTHPEKLSTTTRPWTNILRQDIPSMHEHDDMTTFFIMLIFFSEHSHLLFPVTET